ncbi:hypothetical protein CAEBREN_31097 [Caenorhabditis brenneri]|uniref:Uncharacterized protein n=1 Tax=Caenorhabditis brenneri TaxID=135651 RepID=G0PKH0_CAEBE|nr:hypothetical protein CAEBREN_31097 [Caenorhabditis brenneri]
MVHRSRIRFSSRDLHDSQSSSLGRPPLGQSSSQTSLSFKDTLKTTVFGPTDGHVTRITKRARELMTAGRRLLSTLQELSPEQDGYQQCLEKADGLLVSMKRYAHKLGSVHNYVSNKFDTPEMEASLEKELYLHEIRETISNSGAEILCKELQIIGKTIEGQLTSLNFPCTQYVPSDGISSDEDTLEKRRVKAMSLPQAGSSPAQAASTSHNEDSMRNTAHAQPICNTGAELQDNSTPILPLASRILPDSARSSGHALEAISRQKDLEILTLKAELDKERSRKREADAAEAQAAQQQKPVPTPTVDTVPKANMTAESQQPDLHPSVIAALERMHQDTLKSMDKLTSFMTDWRRDQEEERYADEYERYARGAGDDDNTHSPPPAANFADAPNTVPVPQAQFYRRFDATEHLSDYDGSGDLDVFQSLFEGVVMADATLTFNDRYLLLRETLKGKATACLIHDDEAELAIKKTFAALNRAFGHSQTEISLLGKLVSLPFHPIDPKQMRLDLVNITVVIERLKQKGFPQSDKRTLWDIAAKLPPAIRRDIADYLAEHETAVTHDSLVERIFARINALDMRNTICAQGRSSASNEIYEIPDSYASINHANASHANSAPAELSYSRRPAQKQDGFKGKGLRPLAYKADGLPAEYVDPITGQILPGYYTPGPRGPNIPILHRTFPSSTREPSKCAVCDGPHNAMRCNLSSTEFRETLKAKNLCPICTGGHMITQCRCPHTCGYCDGLHHMGACPKKEFYRIPANLPSGVRDREKFFREPRRNISH